MFEFILESFSSQNRNNNNNHNHHRHRSNLSIMNMCLNLNIAKFILLICLTLIFVTSSNNNHNCYGLSSGLGGVNVFNYGGNSVGLADAKIIENYDRSTILENHKSFLKERNVKKRSHNIRKRSADGSTSSSGEKVSDTCSSVRKYFDTIGITVEKDFNNKGSICKGSCCTNSIEEELKRKSTSNFEQLLRDHTTSLRGILETTSSSFRNHILELTKQSENKTLNVFSQVYRRMLPLSRQLITDLYSNIRIYLSTTNDYQLQTAMHTFFTNLFPVAYHQAVHLNNDGGLGDLHDDYIQCLKNTFDSLQPFGDIPKELAKNLVQSFTTATVFTSALENGAQILSSTEDLDSMYLTSECQTHLLKMSYCPQCNGHTKHHVKSCNGYCLNVMRGCLAQYVGVLDGPWSNFAEVIERLVSTSIQSNTGIVNTIKGLDAKLSEAIMRAMENGPELEKKVKKTCGNPKILPLEKGNTNDNRPLPQQAVKWATPPDTELLHFLSTIEKSKDFYSKIVDNVCEDDEYQRNDRHCWTGERVGDYTQNVMPTGVDTQKYNPEVPFVQHSFERVTKLNELVDKLIKLRSTIVNALPSNPRSYSDIQGDMARHDEEGSGALRDDSDDDEYNIHGSGAGSGDGSTSLPDDSEPSGKSNEISGAFSTIQNSSISAVLFLEALVVLLVTVKQYHLILH